jgi:hypothetical protein
VALAASPLLSSQSVDTYCVFCVSAAPSRDRTGVPFIVAFRSRRFRRDEVCGVWTHEGKDRHHHAARLLGCLVPSLLHLVAFSIDFFF